MSCAAQIRPAVPARLRAFSNAPPAVSALPPADQPKPQASGGDILDRADRLVRERLEPINMTACLRESMGAHPRPSAGGMARERASISASPETRYCRGRRVADKRYIGEALGRQSDFRNIPKRLTDTRGPRQPECGCLRGWLGSCCSGVHADQRGSLCKREPTEEFSPVELLSVSRAQADLPSAYRSVRYHSA